MHKFNLLNQYSKYNNVPLHKLLNNNGHLLRNYLHDMGFVHTKLLLSRTFIAKTILGDNQNSLVFNNCPYGIQLSHNFLITFAYTGILLINLTSHHFIKHVNCYNIFIPNSQVESGSILSSSKLFNDIRLSTSLGELALRVSHHKISNNPQSINLLLLPYQLTQVSGNILNLNINVQYAQSFQHINEYLTHIDKNVDALASYAVPVFTKSNRLSLFCLMNNDLVLCQLIHRHMGYFFADKNLIFHARLKKRLYYIKATHTVAIQTPHQLVCFRFGKNDFNFCNSKANNKIDNSAVDYRTQSKKYIHQYLHKHCREISQQQLQHLQEQF